jgi:hypothetical protein
MNNIHPIFQTILCGIFPPKKETKYHVNKAGCLCETTYVNGKPVSGKVYSKIGITD